MSGTPEHVHIIIQKQNIMISVILFHNSRYVNSIIIVKTSLKYI